MGSSSVQPACPSKIKIEHSTLKTPEQICQICHARPTRHACVRGALGHPLPARLALAVHRRSGSRARKWHCQACGGRMGGLPTSRRLGGTAGLRKGRLLGIGVFSPIDSFMTYFKTSCLCLHGGRWFYDTAKGFRRLQSFCA